MGETSDVEMLLHIRFNPLRVFPSNDTPSHDRQGDNTPNKCDSRRYLPESGSLYEGRHDRLFPPRHRLQEIGPSLRTTQAFTRYGS